jgi:hypothetical protein
MSARATNNFPNVRRRLLLPPGMLEDRKVIDRCVVPTKEGPCGAEFYQGQEELRDRHVAECCRRHAEEIAAVREHQHPSIMAPWDPEFADWMTANRRGIAEGRVRP